MKPAALRIFVSIGLLAIAVEFCPAAPTSERHPNVLFIAVDDLNDWVGCLGGHPQAKTPALYTVAGARHAVPQRARPGAAVQSFALESAHRLASIHHRHLWPRARNSRCRGHEG